MILADVKPKRRAHGPCTCTVDINVSDTIRNIFDQVNMEQRKMDEQTYLKYIANKILNDNVDVRLYCWFIFVTCRYYWVRYFLVVSSLC